MECVDIEKIASDFAWIAAFSGCDGDAVRPEMGRWGQSAVEDYIARCMGYELTDWINSNVSTAAALAHADVIGDEAIRQILIDGGHDYSEGDEHNTVCRDVAALHDIHERVRRLLGDSGDVLAWAVEQRFGRPLANPVRFNYCHRYGVRVVR